MKSHFSFAQTFRDEPRAVGRGQLLRVANCGGARRWSAVVREVRADRCSHGFPPFQIEEMPEIGRATQRHARTGGRSDGVSPRIAMSAARDSCARRRDDPSSMSSRFNDTAQPSYIAISGLTPSGSLQRFASFFQRGVQRLLPPRALDFGDLSRHHEPRRRDILHCNPRLTPSGSLL